jgi:hypothetical protein
MNAKRVVPFLFLLVLLVTAAATHRGKRYSRRKPRKPIEMMIHEGRDLTEQRSEL